MSAWSNWEIARAALITMVTVGAIGFFLVYFFEFWLAVSRKRHAAMDEDYESRHCKRCGYDLRASGDRCPECGTIQADHRRYLRALSGDWPDTPVNPVPPHVGDPMVLLLSTVDAWEADLTAEQLCARGVWATAVEHEQRELIGALATTTVYHRVSVPESEKDRAEAILARFGEPAADVPQGKHAE